MFDVGDSILNSIDERGFVSKEYTVKIRNHSGAISVDIVDYIRPVILQKQDTLIIHSGTNDITNNVNFLKNVKTIGREMRIDSPDTKIVFSSLFRRCDIQYASMVDEINNRLKNYCQQQNMD